MKKLAIGILAHVDAGKTTLSEGMMYLTGMLRKPGRVDHGDAFLDNFALERSRGITIFSKQAVFPLEDKEITLLDTPGHVDFSAEMERTLSVLDYAILVISGPDGVQGHTETVWRLLRDYRIPTFIFVNKMDQEGADREEILENLRNYLGDSCIPFDVDRHGQDFQEALAMADEEALDNYLQGHTLTDADMVRLIAARKVFPCWFGSALKLQGVDDFLNGLDRFTRIPAYKKEFAAKVYKISRDEQGNRLTHLKVTGGTLKVKMPLGEEKIDQIRIYSGPRFTLADQAAAGTICAVTGLSETAAGRGMGEEADALLPVLTPVLSCQLILPEGLDVVKALRSFRELEEEEPQLHIMWNPRLQEIQVQLMGEVQTEILSDMIRERYGWEVSFGKEHIMYRETIRGRAAGVGHYEPLRHYAEVHLRLTEGEPGSGLIFDTECPEDELDRNWQRLILTHLYEKEHVGVLTGSPVTDIRVTLTAGKAHLKHTEGGDFRQATYRAFRQGLMNAREDSRCILLEPVYEFRMELPADQIGRGMADIQRMYGSFEEPEINGSRAVLKGKAPVSEMMDYQKELWSYTGGRGRLLLKLAGYEPCHNSQQVIEEYAYDAEGDTDNPSGSIFCAHGAGFFVPWQQVPDYMHLRDPYFEETAGVTAGEKDSSSRRPEPEVKENHRYRDISYAEEKELQEIFEREFGKKERKKPGYRKQSSVNDFGNVTRKEGPATRKESSATRQKEENGITYLLVDGYNIIFAWEELAHLAESGTNGMDAARNKLMDILCNYQGYTGVRLILVFDAYRVKGNHREVVRHHNIHVVYTKEAETADQYIEKTSHELAGRYRVRVATSDALEQVIVMGQGAQRVSARDFYEEVEQVNEAIRRIEKEKRREGKNYLFDHMDDDLAREMEQVRLGKKELKEKENNK